MLLCVSKLARWPVAGRIHECTYVENGAANFCFLGPRSARFHHVIPPTPANYLNMTSLIATRGGIYKSTVKLRALCLCNQRGGDYLLTSRACNERAWGVFPGGKMLASARGGAFKDPVNLKYIHPSSDAEFQTHLCVSCPIKAGTPPPPQDPGLSVQ